jgi:hypothetical protein
MFDTLDAKSRDVREASRANQGHLYASPDAAVG